MKELSLNIDLPSRSVRLGELMSTKQTPIAKRYRDALVEGFTRYVVYVVKNQRSVLYIGATHYSARDRLRHHIANKSALGKAIKNNSASAKWSVLMIRAESYAQALTVEADLTAQLRPTLCKSLKEANQ